MSSRRSTWTMASSTAIADADDRFDAIATDGARDKGGEGDKMTTTKKKTAAASSTTTGDDMASEAEGGKGRTESSETDEIMIRKRRKTSGSSAKASMADDVGGSTAAPSSTEAMASSVEKKTKKKAPTHQQWKERTPMSRLWDPRSSTIAASTSTSTSLDELARRRDARLRGGGVGGCRSPSTSTSPLMTTTMTTTTCPIRPSLSRYGATPPAPVARHGGSPSVADVARSYVERVLLREGDGTRTIHRSSSERRRPMESTDRSSHATERPAAAEEKEDPEFVVEPVNLRSVMDDEAGEVDESTPSWTWEGSDEDAYRLAMAFGSNAAADHDDDTTDGRRSVSARKTIERRLEMLVRKVKNVGGSSNYAGPNLDGASSYLESLLRTLIRPSNSGVWSRLIDESGGMDTPLTLRRGRTSLISFLIAIDAPGRQDAVSQLASSPVPCYLGYLSPSEDYRSSRRRGKEQVVHRTSYFLPAVESGDMTLPPSPMVTEVGLSMCVRNFLHGNVPGGGSLASYAGEGNSGGVEIFRNRGLPQSANLNSREKSLRSIRAPLPNANELAFDLFDLTLRLAADEDSEHESKPFPLRLATPSASESLVIILRAVSDHSDWLSPIAIAPRYRFVLQRIIETFHTKNVLKRPSDNLAEFSNEDFLLWSKRASFFIDSTKIPNRGNIALFATQFMMMICSRKRNGSFPSPNQSHFYDRLQLHKTSSFWAEIDSIATDVPSNVLARVLDRNFAMRYLLPLAFRCTLLLAASSTPSQRNESISAQTQDSQEVQSIVTILFSVLEVLADNGLLRDCIHLGWAVRILAATIGHFVYGEEYHFRKRETKTFSDCNSISSSVWECLSCQLNNLYFSTWGIDSHSYISLCRSQKNCIYYEYIGCDCKGSVSMMVLLPPLDIFFSSLIEFVCSLQSDPDSVEGFCQFQAIILFDFYQRGFKSCAYPTSGCDDVGYSNQSEFSLISCWLAALASNLQRIVYHQVNSIERDEKVADALTEDFLNDLITPLLKALHRNIIGHITRSSPSRWQNKTDSPNCSRSSEIVASIFVRLHRQEVDQFVKNPSSKKAGLVYRKCLEKIFFMTPPTYLFACHGYFDVTDHAGEILTGVCNIFGQFELSHSIFIMVAAALYMDARAKELKLLLSHDRSRQVGLLSQDDLRQADLSLRLKESCKKFTSHAKNTILGSIMSADRTTQIHTHSQNKINYLVWGVRRELTLRGEIGDALEWWNQMSSDIFSMVNNSNDQALHHNKLDATSKNLLTARSTLQSNLSVIYYNSNQS